MHANLTALTIIRIYLTAVLGWGVVGALSTYVLLLGVFSWVGYTEGLTFSLLPVPGFFALCMGVGAFMGGASGVEAGQIEVYAQQDALRHARQAHPATRAFTQAEIDEYN